jgi:hypothetical protein
MAESYKIGLDIWGRIKAKESCSGIIFSCKDCDLDQYCKDNQPDARAYGEFDWVEFDKAIDSQVLKVIIGGILDG